jgi:MoxR-like ATPase
MEQELNIVRLKVPDLNVKLAQQAVQIVQRLRTLDLKKSPSVSETLDWAKALVALNADHMDEATLNNTLTVLLKHEADVQRARGSIDNSRTAGAADLDRYTPQYGNDPRRRRGR